MIKQAYISGFIKKCAESGLSREETERIISELGTQLGANGLEDSEENDYGPGIIDSFKNLWTPSEIMAKKQRRFESDYKKKRGLDKMFAQIKHPVRSARADQTAGAMGLTTAAVAAVLAQLIATRRGL